MHVIDWMLLGVPIAAVLAFAVYTRRYVKSVADFLAGGRCAGRYLLANARGESDAGLSNTMSKFEIIMVSGFVLNFWEKISTPILLLIGISGFVIYRYRETRALTLAQFFEMRYSRAFRLFMGMLAFVSGVLNYGVFPAISARFFIYFLGLPQHFSVGSIEISTFATIMLGYLSVTVFMLLIGGQVTMMLTDCLEGLFSHLIYVVIAVAVFFIVSWPQVMQVMETNPPGRSMINPFDAGKVEDFNLAFVLMVLATRIYGTMALQNKQGFNAAARSAHESRMGGVLGEWRGYARMLMLLVLGVCAVTFMRHPAFAQQAAPIHEAIASIKDAQLQKQMTVPIALSYLLPVGIKGLFCAIMVMGLLAGDAGHMHSWGSIFVQDVMLPLRRTPLSPKAHMLALRLAVVGVAAFAFVFSLVWTQTQYIALWWAMTSGVYIGAAGAAIIGGLYWKRGTTLGAWAGALTGATLSFIGIILSNGATWRWIVDEAAPLGYTLPPRFWLNGQIVAFVSCCATIAVYVAVSLATCRVPFNLDKTLHRGPYALAGDESGATVSAQLSWRDRFRLKNILRFDRNFTFVDKLVAGGIFWWAVFLLGVNIVVSAWNFSSRWPIERWAHYWMIFGIALPCLIALGTLIWFGIGGIRDIRDFLRALRTMKRDPRDDGRVVDSQNLADQPLPGAFPVERRTAAAPLAEPS
jgi:SSS family solute:Na+ symporter